MFLFFVILLISAVIAGIAFYPSQDATQSGPILNLICKNQVNAAVNAATINWNKEKSILQKKYDTCNVDCVTSDWSQWGICSQDCGGTQNRSKRIITPAKNGGLACPANLQQSQFCNKINTCGNVVLTKDTISLWINTIEPMQQANNADTQFDWSRLYFKGIELYVLSLSSSSFGPNSGNLYGEIVPYLSESQPTITYNNNDNTFLFEKNLYNNNFAVTPPKKIILKYNNITYEINIDSVDTSTPQVTFHL